MKCEICKKEKTIFNKHTACIEEELSINLKIALETVLEMQDRMNGIEKKVKKLEQENKALYLALTRMFKINE